MTAHLPQGVAGHVIKIAAVLAALGTIWTYTDSLGLRPLFMKDLVSINDTIDNKVEELDLKIKDLNGRFIDHITPEDEKALALRFAIEEVHTLIIKDKEKYNNLTEEDKRFYCQSAHNLTYNYLPGYCYPFINLNEEQTFTRETLKLGPK